MSKNISADKVKSLLTCFCIFLNRFLALHFSVFTFLVFGRVWVSSKLIQQASGKHFLVSFMTVHITSYELVQYHIRMIYGVNGIDDLVNRIVYLSEVASSVDGGDVPTFRLPLFPFLVLR